MQRRLFYELFFTFAVTTDFLGFIFSQLFTDKNPPYEKTILLIAVVLAAGAVSGQKTFTFGPKVGINIADLYASSAENTRDLNGTKPSLIVGAFAEYRALKWLAVSADVLYSRQGSTDKATWTERGPGGGFVTESEEFSYRLNYLNIPILANFYVTKGLALKAGIQPGFLIGSKLRVRSNDGPWETADLKDENLFRTTDIAIPVGLSYTLDYGLVIDARYNFSLNDIATDTFKEEIAQEGGDLKKIKNRVFSLTLGWKF